MTDSSYNIKLPVFEGPFDLLLHLIRQNEIDIYDIPIAEITDQYLDYLQRMEELDLEIASSFLVMAATLLSIKAKMLLPRPLADDDEETEAEDAREGLVHDLLEYMMFKDAAQAMNQLYEEQKHYISRDNEPELYANLFSAENPLEGKTLADLQKAFTKVLHKAKEQGKLLLEIEREQVTMGERLEYLYQLLQKQPHGLVFADAFADCCTKMQYIVTFLALLELVHQGVVSVTQNEAYGEIYLHIGDLTKYVQRA